MKLCRDSLEDLIADGRPVIGFWGVPSQEVLLATEERFGGLEFFDLDIHYGAPATRTAPDAFCHIIRNCVDNALALGEQLECVVASTGPEKCDAARYAAALISPRISGHVIPVTNEKPTAQGPALLCESKGPLKRRVIRIMDAIIEPLEDRERTSAFMSKGRPTHGFWGTPPHPIELLDLFPETTNIYGWTRCVEQGRPSDLELEMQVPEGLPTVFFSQGFCAKSMLARQLAEKHGGMHVDVHDSLGAATIAKIEAFIRLSGQED